MWLTDVSYNLLDISRGRYFRRGYGDCLMKHLSGKSIAAMAARWSDRMEWGREGRITRKVFVCVSHHISVFLSSWYFFLCVCTHYHTSDLHLKWTILQPVDKYIHLPMIWRYIHITRVRAHSFKNMLAELREALITLTKTPRLSSYTKLIIQPSVSNITELHWTYFLFHSHFFGFLSCKRIDMLNEWRVAQMQQKPLT